MGRKSNRKVQTQFIKGILGVNRLTSTLMLKSRIIIRNVRYLNQIKLQNDNILVKQAYIYMKKCKPKIEYLLKIL